jgi:ubiquinone/menaquinone biosynthesis C-methylase UbiE
VESFGPIAPYYDELMASVPYRMWVGYYLLLLAQQDAHPKKILDVCCGTGTMAEMLQREGFSMTGLDIAPGMIEAARKKAVKKKLPIRYECLDAAEFELGDTFDAALSFFDSLNNIIEPARFQMALGQVAKHLKPGGSFIFDLNTAFAFEERMFTQKKLHPNAKLRYDWVGDYNPDTRLITVDMKFWYEGNEFHETHVQRAYDESEVREMLARAGFVEVKTYTSYTLDPLRGRSDRAHYAAIRA